MTIYHRLKVWAIKACRFVKFGFRKTSHRGSNVIWLSPVQAKCDYCTEQELCVTLEADYEVVVTICGNCLMTCRDVLAGVY